MLALNSLRTLLTVGVILAWFAPRAGADILDNILDTAQTASNRAAAARDRATEARDSAHEIRDNLRDGLEMITGDIQAAIDDAVEDFQRFRLQITEGRDDFVIDGGCSIAVCQPFRQDLVNTIQQIESIFDEIFAFAGAGTMDADFQRLIDVIQNMPGRALYPLYRVIEEDNNMLSSGLLTQLTETLTSLQLVRSTLFPPGPLSNAPNMAGSNALDDALMTCQPVLANETALRVAQGTLLFNAGRFMLLGKVMKAAATTEAHVNGGQFVLATIKTNPPQAIGEFFEGLADGLLTIMGAISGQISECAQLAAQGVVRDEVINTQDQLELARQEILAAIAAFAANPCADLNVDGNVDLADYSIMATQFTGP